MNLTKDDTETYLDIFVATMNILLAENFDRNNGLRKIGGKAILTDIPEIATVGDTFPYENRFEIIFAYGCAGLMLEENPELANQRANKYEYERSMIGPVVWTDVIDVYGGSI